MTIDPDVITRLKTALDADAALDLLRRAVGTPSVTGTEAAFASLLAGELTALGCEDVVLKEFAPGRPNVRGLLRGEGKASRLLVTGHTDTVHVRGWEERWAGTERESPFGGAIVDGSIWGRGTGDLKAGICTTIAAAKLLASAGITPPSAIQFAFIGDEESGEPDTGVSAGIKAFVAEIEAGAVARPDFAVYVEPTRLNIYAAQMGFLICDITITGRSAYFGVPELGVDALKATHGILSALWAHSAVLEARAPHALVGHPFVLVTGLEGGGYIAVPGECRVSLILKLMPGENLDTAVRDLESAVRGARVDPEISIAFAYPAGRDHAVGGTPTEVSQQLPGVTLLRQAVQAVRPDRGAIEGAPYWSEAPFLVNRLDVPTVYCAPGDIRNCHTLEEHVVVQEYLDGIVAMAAFFASFDTTAS
ncbi:M20 family metallopeptidase [Mesorhizobium sp. INR15]|uniref:M20 family metallopeptidase n=1 Tax=Mesorhizobium sp. INR15 TaxID=2654248 RepID=UPI0018966FA0|nr:M20/M25/M40 family metallo-hydrolase [Mesorhizobium sp. INR15]QPC89376.1 M20/M25/M40 family metallo-hydrolase [Mesorhizobium sp. INR15]